MSSRKRNRSGGSGGGSGRWTRYQRPATDDVERENRDPHGRPLPEPTPSVPAPAPAAGRNARPRRGRLRWAAVAAGLAGIGLLRAFGGGEPAPEPYPAEERYQPIATADSFAALSVALQEKTGRTAILELRGYGTDDIQVTVPPARPDDLAEVWEWDGKVLEKWMGEQPRDKLPFDLGSVDPEVLVRLDEEARGRSDGRISSSHYDVEKPVDPAYDHWVYLSVSEVDHGGVVLWADLDGTVESELINKSWRDD